MILCFRINVTNVRLIITTDLIEVKIEPEDTRSTESTFSNSLEKNQFICNECYNRFDDFEEFVIHKNLSHKNKHYVCYICNAQFVLSAHLNLYFTKHDHCLRSSSEIQSSSRSNLTKNLSHDIYNDRSTITRFHKCDFCLKIFNSFSALNDHLQYDTHRIEII